MLSSAVAMWPTPRANDSEKRGDIAIDPRNGLPSAVKLWPTPITQDAKHSAISPAQSGKGLLTNAVLESKLWPTPHRNCSNGAGEHGDGGRNIQTAAGGTLNPDWVEILMGFPIGWTDIDCDNPQPWPGWPAMMGETVMWRTPARQDPGISASRLTGKPGARMYDKETGRLAQYGLAQQLAIADCMSSTQYPYEPPRTCGKIPNRAKRLKALGNAVVPQQFAPIFRAIAEMEVCE